MNKYTFQYKKISTTDSTKWLQKEFTTFAENEQEATDYANVKIPEIVNQFNSNFPINNAKVENIELMRVEKVK